MKVFAKKNHNHSKCSAKALIKAKEFCQENNLAFSPMRELVFKLIWQSHKGITAYELLEILKKDNKKIVATTIYRALEFLEQNGLVHKIYRNNSYIGCSFVGEKHIPILFICSECGEVGEVFRKDAFKSISKNIDENNFKVERIITEICGVCEECQKIQ